MVYVCQAGLKIVDFASVSVCVFVCVYCICVCVVFEGELAHTLGIQAVAVATAMVI